MAERTVTRSGGHYHLVRYSAHGRPKGEAIYQIEDLAGNTICHCGSSQREADQLFEALEYPGRRPKRRPRQELRAFLAQAVVS